MSSAAGSHVRRVMTAGRLLRAITREMQRGGCQCENQSAAVNGAWVCSGLQTAAQPLTHCCLPAPPLTHYCCRAHSHLWSVQYRFKIKCKWFRLLYNITIRDFYFETRTNLRINQEWTITKQGVTPTRLKNKPVLIPRTKPRPKAELQLEIG